MLSVRTLGQLNLANTLQILKECKFTNKYLKRRRTRMICAKRGRSITNPKQVEDAAETGITVVKMVCLYCIIRLKGANSCQTT